MKNNKQRLINSILMALIPVLICSINACISGGFIWNASLLVSDWNDELFYYKQVEAILSHGIPQGYYGFNESSALHLSFAAWSPVILLPWVLWGIIFGWNLFSPILCNIVLLSVAFFVCAWLFAIEIKKVATVAILMTAFLPLSRYVFSAMPEANIISACIIIFTIYYYNADKNKNSMLNLELLLISLLTLSRPYFAMLYLLPLRCALVKKKSNLLVVMGTGIISLGGYFVISKLLTASYFSSIFSLSWGKVFVTDGFFAGLKNIILILSDKCFLLMSDYWKNWLADRNSTGAYFALLLAFLAFWLVECILAFIRKEYSRAVDTLFMFIFHLTMLMSVLLMYKLIEGSRHFIWLIACDLVLLAVTRSGYYNLTDVVVAFALAFLFCFSPNARMLYSAPIVSAKNIEALRKVENINELASCFDDCFIISDALSWDNDVIWMLTDYVYDGEGKKHSMVPFNYAYLLPDELAVNCCENEYVWNYINYLKSKYIMVSTNGETKNALVDNNAKYLCGDDVISIYQIR